MTYLMGSRFKGLPAFGGAGGDQGSGFKGSLLSPSELRRASRIQRYEFGIRNAEKIKESKN